MERFKDSMQKVANGPAQGRHRVEDPVLPGWQCSLSGHQTPVKLLVQSLSELQLGSEMLLSGGVLAWPVYKALGSSPSSAQTNQQCPCRGGQDDLILRDPG